jgi:hypothetical protein
MALRALGGGGREEHAPRGQGGIGLDHDPVGLGGRGEVVLALDSDLLGVGAGLEADRVPGLGRIHRSLDGGVARALALAGGVRAVDEADDALLGGRGGGYPGHHRRQRRRHQPPSPPWEIHGAPDLKAFHSSAVPHFI